MIQRRSRAPGTGAVLANFDIRPQSARALPPLPHLTRTLEHGQRGGECSQDHDAGQVVLRREATFAGDLGSAAALDGVGPGLGQVEPAVDQGVAQGGGVGGEDADLAVLGAAGGVGVGPVYAG